MASANLTKKEPEGESIPEPRKENDKPAAKIPPRRNPAGGEKKSFKNAPPVAAQPLKPSKPPPPPPLEDKMYAKQYFYMFESQ